MQKIIIPERLKAYFNGNALGLPSVNFYKNLDYDLIYFGHNDIRDMRVKELEEYHNICEKFLKKYKNIWIKSLCAVLLKYLKTSSKISNKQNNDYEDCTLLSYWVYDRLSGIYHKYPRVIKIMYANLQLLWNYLIEHSVYSSFYDKCKPDFHIPSQYNWKKRKELYDYCVDYQTLFNTAINYDKKRSYIYKYINNKAPLYAEFDRHCPQDDNDKCPEFLRKCKDHNPENVLNHIECKIKLRTEKTQDSSTACPHEFSSHSHTQSNSSLEDQTGKPFVPSSDDAFGSTDELTIDDDSSIHIYRVDGFFDLFINNDSSNIVGILGKIFLGLVLFTTLSGILYKFTPIGIRLRKVFKRKKNIIRGKNRHRDELFGYPSESHYPNYVNEDEQYIGYHTE
ncbi:variable surface protein [Plasmodium gonderi]|uniref:Variable surface protein n=1 Tax=Plasmodium gonderi TaxID=77519 RepID=A0A1Y1JV39_PLAGO|nr:variable surface protein [Plasmodium gonderi]GAW84263.1 variable surface protein [Plasmodium gonderi]